MHEKNIALLCDEADRLLQLNINLLRQMVEEPDVLSDSKNENRLLFDKQKALKRIEELEGEQIKTARREMVLAVVGTMKAGKSTTINAIVGQEILPNRNRPMTSVPTLIRHVPGKTEPVLHLEHIQPVRNLLITLQEKLATPAGQQVAQTLQQTGDTRELLDILTDDGWLKNEYHGEEEIFTGLASLNDLVRLAAAILEIRPRKRLKYAGDGGNSGGLLSFTSAHTDAWRQQGYEDTMLAMEHIRKPLAARQALTRSEAVLQKSLDITEEADLALRNAMARIK